MTRINASAQPERPRDQTAPAPQAAPQTAPQTGGQLLRAILTDTHFWVPTIVLALGILLLVALH